MSATPLVVNAVVVSFRATDWRRNQGPRLWTMTAPRDFGEPEQSRTQVQPRPLRRLDVNCEAHPATLDVQLDDAARLREALGVADRQHRERFYLAQSVGGSLRLGIWDEQQVAGPPGGTVPSTPDLQQVAVDVLIAHRLDERGGDPLVADDAQHD